MKNRENYQMRLSHYLDDKTKLALRLVSKKQGECLKDNQDSPYKTKVEFAIALAGIFRDKNYLSCAWFVYQSTISSSSLMPAMLYKLTDMDNFKINGTYAKFANNEDVHANGRIYTPINGHAWNTNQAWVLAQAHIKRPFVLYSELSQKYIMRRNYPTVFSALAKEIATAIKANYTISITDEGLVKFNPPNDSSEKQLMMTDLNVSDTEIESAVNKVNEAKANHGIAIVAAQKLQKIFDEIENYKLQELKVFQPKLNEKISSIINEVFLNCVNKKLAMDSFTKAFNSNRPYFSSKISKDNSFKLFFDSNQITTITKKITSDLSKRVVELIEIEKPKQQAIKKLF